jgi:simple sugar transport system permease protein
MRLELAKRPERSAVMAVLSPVLAVALTVVTGAALFAALGVPPLAGLYVFFVEPLASAWSLQELIVKATPLVLIGAGLAVCYRANVWNIGAEGQLTFGAILGAIPAVFAPSWQSPATLVVMLALGALGGLLFALIPAYLRIRFRTNEILVSLMLVYVAQLLLDWLVRGPWRDPKGYNFPKTIAFEDWQTLPNIPGTDVPIGAAIALAAAVVLALMMGMTLKGYEVKVVGAAPRAGRFAGFSTDKLVVFVFAVSGALAGLAGIMEVMTKVGHLQPNISPGYGFSAIIVAFLGRLNPLGAVVAGVALAVSYLGGEAAQVALGLSDKAARVFQGVLLFYILACDTLILYRIRLVPGVPAGAHAEAR